MTKLVVMHAIRLYGPWILSSISLCLALCSFVPCTKVDPRFSHKFLMNVKSCVEFSKEINSKDEIYNILDQLQKQFHNLETGTDDLRVKFVHAQGCIEHVLACFQALGEIDHLMGVIHTPMPATPLCVVPDGSMADILDQSIRNNTEKLLTVRSRAKIVREYLLKGGQLYISYPEGGLEKRTPSQQAIYLAELNRYAGNLFDSVLSTHQMDEDMIGATYLFRNQDHEVLAFSIKARQANDITPQAEWGIWFGPINENVVIDRANQIFDYLSQYQGPDLRKADCFAGNPF